jgi:ABC-type lipoprotein release transport system permease subunit
LVAAVVMLVAIAAIAGCIPARKASLVEPTVALRCE